MSSLNTSIFSEILENCVKNPKFFEIAQFFMNIQLKNGNDFETFLQKT